MKTRLCVSIVLATLLSGAFLTNAYADIAPPLQPPGANPAPLEYENTMVEMGYELVEINVLGASDLYYLDTPTDTVDAMVIATFVMSNRGETAETLKVLFPLSNMNGSGDGWRSQPEIQNLSIIVGSQPAVWVEITSPHPGNPGNPDIKWAEFEVDFPIDEVVWIDISYDLQSTGYFPEATFYYILETGGGWYGPIGSAYINLTLPYEASDENVLQGDHNMMPFEYKTSPDGIFKDNTVHWEYKDIEPTAEDNLVVTIIVPHVWEQILSLRDEIEQGEGSAYAKITKLYDAIIMNRSVRSGAEGLVFKNYETYQKAIEFDPSNDEVLARFADFKLFLYMNDRDSQETPAGLEDIHAMASLALEMNPLNDTAYQVINWLEKSLDFTPAAPSTAAEQPTEIGSQDTDATPADDADQGEDKRGDLSQDENGQKNTAAYLLGAGLLAAVGVIIALAYKLGKKNAS
ncbi:MAG: hypothetical protein Q7J07_00140 [Pelolinea sp.]|nr:hypothetical protein [Pelolinea sp.]